MKQSKQPKTNATRLLDKQHVTYTAFTYPATVHSADEVALLLGVPASQVFKTLVALADHSRYLLMIVPGDRKLDARLAAQAIRAKQVHMLPQREAERLTGLKVGGISPLALLDKHFEIYLDASSTQLETLYINGGQRGLNLHIRVSDLLTLTGATVIHATTPPNAADSSAALAQDNMEMV